MTRSLWRDKDSLVRELFDYVRRLTEVCGQDFDGVAGDPLGEVDRFVFAGVEANEEAAARLADVFDGVAEALGDVADIALVERFGAVAAVGAEHGDADLAFDDVLPFIGRGVPVEFAEAAGFQVEDYASDRGGDGEAGRVDAPFAAAFVNRVGRFGEHAELVREGRLFAALQVGLLRGGGLGRGRSRLLFRESWRTWTRACQSFWRAELWRAWPIQSVMLNVPNSEK